MEVNQHERYDVFAGTHALKVFRMSIASAASERHTEHGHRQITASLDAGVACFHTDMDGLIHAHPPREAEPDCTVVWLLLKALSGAGRAARLRQDFFRNEAFMRDGWNAVATEPNVYYEAE